MIAPLKVPLQASDLFHLLLIVCNIISNDIKEDLEGLWNRLILLFENEFFLKMVWSNKILPQNWKFYGDLQDWPLIIVHNY